MDELNQNESAVIEEMAENQEAMKCDSCGNHGGKQKNNNSSLLKAGIALMFATSVLSLGVSCYQIFSKDDNKVEQSQNMIGSVNDGKMKLEVIDGYIYVNGENTGIAMNAENGKDGLSVADARVIELDKWGITTQILFTMSDGTYVSTAAQKQVLSEHFYEAESVQDFVRLATEFKVPNIRLTSNLELTEAVDFTSNVCVDVNKKAFTYAADEALTVANNATLTFKNGTVNFQTDVAVSVEGTNAGVAFDGVKVNATAVVAETLGADASISVVNSTIKTVEPEFDNYAFGSYESLFVVKGTNATVEVKGTKVQTNRVIVAATDDAETVNVKVESTELNTSAPILDLNTDEVVPTLEFDNEVLYSAELNTSAVTSGNFNFNPMEFGVIVEGEMFDVDGKVVLAEDFTNLVEIVEAGATINLTSDVDLPTAIKLDKKLTIDLCGYRMSVSQDVNGDGVFWIVEGGNLTINDSGRVVEYWNEAEERHEYDYVDGVIDGVGNNKWNIAMFVNGGKLTINGGIFTNVGATGADPTHFDLIYMKGGSLVINGGEFRAQTPKWTINCNDTFVEDSNIAVKGGIFYGFNPAEPQTEPAKYDGISFLAKDYMVVGSNDVYMVGEAEWFEEVVAYEEVDYVAVNANVTLADTITISRNFTLNLQGNTLTTTGEYSAFDLYAGNIVVNNGTINAYYDAFGVYGANAKVALELGSKLTVVSETGNCVYIRGAGASLVTCANLKAESDYAAIQGNGSTGAQVERIVINGGKVEGGDAAIYMPNAGELIITAGEFVGKNALYIKSGSTVISGGKFIATGEYAGFLYNGDGWNQTGDAIVIDACGYPGGNPVVTITGGTFESANADGIAYYSYQNNTATITATGYEVATYVVVSTEAELAAAVANQSIDTIIVGSNIVVNATIEIDRDVTISLGGKTISSTKEIAIFDVVDGNVVFDNGTINAYYDAFGVYGSGESFTLTLGSNLTVIAETGNCVYIRGAGANLVTSANLIANGEYAAIQGNGSTGAEIESITINGGRVEGGDAAIYMPNAGTLTITAGEFVGKTAVYIKSGVVNISGGKFIADGTHANYLFNASGWNPTGDALVVDSCGNPGGYPVVTITGGTFEVADSNAHGIAYYICDNNNAKVVAPDYYVYWLPVTSK